MRTTRSMYVATAAAALLSLATVLLLGAPSLPATLVAPASGFVPDTALSLYAEPQHLAAVPAGPGKVAQPVADVLSAPRIVDTLGESGIPEIALRADMRAADRLASSDPSCGPSWTVLAAIGRVESDHGRFGGTSLRADGSGTMRIRGIPLDGRPDVVLIRDTDGAVLDGDTTYDRAVGPMQFIPSTWRLVMADGNGDGRADPHNIYDAALGAARYLCTGPANLRDPAQLAAAIRTYNNADSYVRVVLTLARRYATGPMTVLPTAPVLPTPVDPWRVQQPALPRTTHPTNRPTTSITRQPTTQPNPPKPPKARQIPPAPTQTPPPPTMPTSTAPPPEPTTPSPTTPPTTTPTDQPSEPSATSTPTLIRTPSETEPSEPTPTATQTEAPITAAVGWAPAMRQQVLRTLGAQRAKASPPSAVLTTPGAGCHQPCAVRRHNSRG